MLFICHVIPSRDAAAATATVVVPQRDSRQLYIRVYLLRKRERERRANIAKRGGPQIVATSFVSLAEETAGLYMFTL